VFDTFTASEILSIITAGWARALQLFGTAALHDDVNKGAPLQKIAHHTASPERVCRVWSDSNNWSRWNLGIRSAQIDGPLRSGATGTMETNRGGKHAVTFDGVEPRRRMTIRVAGMPGTTFSFFCEIEPNGSGSPSRRASGSPDRSQSSLPL
jgi:hypothetical protein